MYKKICVFVCLLVVLSCAQNVIAKVSEIEIGVSVIVEHPSLTDVVNGFKDALAKKGYKEGVNIKYDIQNANNSIDKAVQIASTFIGHNVKLILAVGTPVAKATKEQTPKIPIVFAAITDPIGSDLVKNASRPAGNLTGTSDMLPVENQFKFIKKIMPKAKRIGVIYNPSESNSVITIERARAAAKKMGLQLVEATANRTSDVRSAAASLVGKVDVLYLTTDNTTASAIGVINDISNENNIPFFSSERKSLDFGTLAFLGIDYYERGEQAGYMASRILKGEKPGDIPLSFPKTYILGINKSVAKRYGIRIPEDVIKQATIVKE